MDVFDAARRYGEEGTPVVILAGKEYGSGSSRDWAAKGPWMQVRTWMSLCCELHYVPESFCEHFLYGQFLFPHL